MVASDLASYSQFAGAAIFADAEPGTVHLKSATIPQILHLAGKESANPDHGASRRVYHYPGVESFLFATPFQTQFTYNAESVSHTRNLTFFKKLLDGPHFDLEAIWDEHTYYEFEARSVECTMATMVQEPYVNHVPTVSTNCIQTLLPRCCSFLSFCLFLSLVLFLFCSEYVQFKP
jgi:carboxymethylenebutenolidase